MANNSDIGNDTSRSRTDSSNNNTNSDRVSGLRVAIIATDGVEQAELQEPKRALDQAGARTTVISPKRGKIKAWQHDHWGDEIPVDLALDEARPNDFDALMLPGGVINADHLRTNGKAVSFVKEMFAAGKPAAVICHAPWLLIEAGVVNGRTITSWPSLQTDLRNAGADWVDREVVTDEGLVTSRKPDDIPAFNSKMLEEFAEGRHEGQREAAHDATSRGASKGTSQTSSDANA